MTALCTRVTLLEADKPSVRQQPSVHKAEQILETWHAWRLLSQAFAAAWAVTHRFGDDGKDPLVFWRSLS